MKKNIRNSIQGRLRLSGGLLALWACWALVLLVFGWSLPAPALLSRPGFAQGVPGQVRFPPTRSDKEDPRAPKNLTGQVVDKEGKGLAQAVVHLKNKKTLEVKTHIADAEGKYRFAGLSPEADYAVHAEHKGAASPARTVSMFDERKDIYLVLEVDTTKR